MRSGGRPVERAWPICALAASRRLSASRTSSPVESARPSAFQAHAQGVAARGGRLLGARGCRESVAAGERGEHVELVGSIGKWR